MTSRLILPSLHTRTSPHHPRASNDSSRKLLSAFLRILTASRPLTTKLIKQRSPSDSVPVPMPELTHINSSPGALLDRRLAIHPTRSQSPNTPPLSLNCLRALLAALSSSSSSSSSSWSRSELYSSLSARLRPTPSIFFSLSVSLASPNENNDNGG